MSFARLLTQTATIVHHPPTGSDAEGDATFGTPTTVDYPCRLEQVQGRGASTTGSEELVEGESRTDTHLLLFLPAEAASAVTFEDEVIVGGLRYQVDGRPDVLRTPRGIHHVEARLRRVAA